MGVGMPYLRSFPECDQVRPGCDGSMSLSNGVTIDVHRIKRRPATMSAIAGTGAMLLCGQQCARVATSAVACRTSSLITSHRSQDLRKFLVSATAPTSAADAPIRVGVIHRAPEPYG